MGSNPTPSAKQEARARKSAGFFYGQSGDETDDGAVASYEERKSKPVLIFAPRNSYLENLRVYIVGSSKAANSCSPSSP